MSLGFILPTLLGVGLVAGMGLFDWRLRPKIAIRLLTGAVAGAALAVAVVSFSTAAAFILGPARSSALTAWCRTIPLHHEVGPFIGIAAVIISVLFSIRCGRVVLSRRRTIQSAKSSGRISICESPVPFAYAVPTREGCVVVSTGLLAPLKPAERQAVFAHERAHLRLGHHRYLLATELSRIILPFLGPLVRQIQHATERAADEAAALAVQDRHVVARAITTTALGPHRQGSTLPALGGGSVTRRVEALLWPHREPAPSRFMAAVAFAGGALAVGALVVQIHHFSTLLDHLCRGVS